MEKRNIIITTFVLVWLLALTAININGITGASVLNNNEQGVCNKLQCTEQYTTQELQQKFCRIENDQILCSISIDGQTGEYPIDQVNWDSIQICKKALCLQEVKARTVNYDVDLSSQN